MASHLYTTAAKEIVDNTIAITSDTLKVMLVKSGYTPNKDDTFIDMAGANDPIDHELTVTGYTGGFGGAGRKTWANVTVIANTTSDRVDIGGDDITWTALGSGETIATALLVKEITNDAASRLICNWDVTDTATNGGDVTLDFTAAASGGNIQITI